VIDIRSLEVFYWVVELRSFSRAAHRLNTSQPAVSQRVGALEQRLGYELLMRPTRTCRLTDRGRILFDYAEQFVRLQAKMESEVISPGNVRRTVRLGVSETIVHTWLPAFVEGVHSEMPNLTIDIMVDITPRMYVSLEAKELDMAFMLGPVSEPGYQSVPLNSYPLSFVAKRGLIAEADRNDIRTIARHPIITYPRETYPLTALREIVSKIIMRQPRIFANASLSTMVKMAKDGIGIALIPAEVVQEDVADGALEVLDIDLGLRPLTFVATYPHELDDHLCEILARKARKIAEDYKMRL